MSLNLLKMFTFVDESIAMKKIQNIVQVLFIWMCTAVCAIVGLCLIPVMGQKTSIKVTSRIWSDIVLGISGVNLIVKGKENLNFSEEVIYISNHESGFDIPVIFKAVPQPLFFLAKAELKKIPFLGWYMSALGMIFIDRRNKVRAKQSLISAGNEIKKGKNIISFPEGSRSLHGEIRLFRRGTFLLALENNINIVPLAVIGTKEINPPGYNISSGTVTLAIGKPIKVNNWDVEQPELLAKHAEDTVRNMVALERMNET